MTYCCLQGQLCGLCLWFWPKRKMRMILRIKMTLKNDVAMSHGDSCCTLYKSFNFYLHFTCIPFSESQDYSLIMTHNNLAFAKHFRYTLKLERWNVGSFTQCNVNEPAELLSTLLKLAMTPKQCTLTMIKTLIYSREFVFRNRNSVH